MRASQTDGQLRCEQVLVPDRPGPVPPVVWSYFGPAAPGYRTHTARVPIHVSLPQRTAAGAAGCGVKGVSFSGPLRSRNRLLFLVPSCSWSRFPPPLAQAGAAVAPASCPQAIGFLLKEVEQASCGWRCRKILQSPHYPAAASGCSGWWKLIPLGHRYTPFNESLSRLLSHCDEVRYGGRVPSCRQIELIWNR